MPRRLRNIFVLLLLTFWVATLATYRSAAQAPLPVAPDDKISYLRDIFPIFQENCVKCHMDGHQKGGLRLDTRELILRGGESGHAVVPHDSEDSILIMLLTVDEDEVRMPKDLKPLTDAQVALISKWIDQGLPWDGPEIAPPVKYVPPLHPRRVEVPEVAELNNPIDRILHAYVDQHEFEPPAVVDDRTFVRRVYLDLIGMLPTPDELNAFISDTRADKRERLVDKLLSDNTRYAEHWLTFWNDALRNDYVGPGYIDGGRKSITSWLYSALESNMAYDQFARALVNPTPEADGFIRGIIWRGAVSASQIREVQAAQNVSQVFLGINLKCASCHDSFIDDWKLADAYGFAGVFADAPLEMFRCEKPLQRSAPVKFLYPELGDIDASAPRPQRVARVAELLTTPDNGRFARTIVNRLWAQLLGRGIVEPVDEMDRQPWSEDLLDWLAMDLVDHDYDLKHVIRRIVTSRAYQLPAVGARESEADFIFRGPVVRRMSAEQFCDAVSALTGVWNAAPAARAIGAGRFELPARWIWSTPNANQRADVGAIYLRKTFDLPELPDEALLAAVCDNRYTLYVNGKRAARGNNHKRPNAIDLKPHLVVGSNVLAVLAENGPFPEEGAPDPKPNPAGFWLSASMRFAGRDELVEINTDATWKWSDTATDGWQRVKFDDSTWQLASDLGPAEMPPWNLPESLASLDRKTFTLRFSDLRAVWVASDTLQTALGRPNREQVITRRDSHATLLQALELTNGRTLADILEQGAARWSQRDVPADQLIYEIFAASLNRPPTLTELQLSRELLNSADRPQAIADLLWSLVMLPEFQLIY